MDPNQLNPQPQPQVASQATLAQPTINVSQVDPLNQPDPKKNFILPLLGVIIFASLMVGGIFFLKNQLKSSASTETSAQVADKVPSGTSCSEGINGNSGDNFCENFHGGASRCTREVVGSYSDNCTKTDSTHE